MADGAPEGRIVDTGGSPGGSRSKAAADGDVALPRDVREGGLPPGLEGCGAVLVRERESAALPEMGKARAIAEEGDARGS